MAEGEVRYCTTADGVRIAYSVQGEGPPLLVCPFFIESFALEHTVPLYEQFWQQFGGRLQLIRYDSRGIGLSERDVDQFSLETLCLDTEAVIKASGVKKVALWASQSSGPFALRFSPTPKRLLARLIRMGAWW
jgi:pimeloyl-ACP methyl ester carboxylesterase